MTLRKYRTASGFWGLGISHSPGNWHLQIGPWVFTTEPGSEIDESEIMTDRKPDATYSNIVRQVAADRRREVTDDEIASILWEFTGYPSFWNGDPLEECEAQVAAYFDAPMNAHRGGPRK